MKVLHVAEIIAGGITTYLSECIPYQVKRYGAENVYILGPQTQTSALQKTAGRISTFRRKTRLRGIFCLAFQLLKVHRAVRPDVIHAHSTLAGAVVRILSPLLRSKIVYCPHGWAFDMDCSPHTIRLIKLI